MGRRGGLYNGETETGSKTAAIHWRTPSNTDVYAPKITRGRVKGKWTPFPAFPKLMQGNDRLMASRLESIESRPRLWRKIPVDLQCPP